MSYLARVSYNYDSKYLVTANFRADGSSKLAPGHRLGLLPLVLGRVAYLGREVPARRVVDQRPETARRLGTDR